MGGAFCSCGLPSLPPPPSVSCTLYLAYEDGLIWPRIPLYPTMLLRTWQKSSVLCVIAPGTTGLYCSS
jgi:hypothetical protein